MGVAMAGYTAGDSDRRPWGRWTVLDSGAGYAVKRIEVVPGGKLSLQRHKWRAEQWIVVAGIATVTRDTEIFDLRSGETVHIGLRQVHRVENRGVSDMVFIEVQTGERLEEGDIERLEDVYGRT